jgi:nucleoside-diphosphate-sugar epimerase
MGLRVLVTGGAGYLGSILTEHLLKADFQVTVVDNLMYGQRSLFHFCTNPKFKFIFGDQRDKRLLQNSIRNADVIIPLAAVVGAPACMRNPWLAEEVNHLSLMMVNNLRSVNQLLIYPTTNSGYGTKSGDVYCTEDTPLEPISKYGIDKVQAEQALLETENVITLRLATVFGFSPRMRRDLLVNDFVWQAYSNRYLVIFEKDFKRNYIHIRDVADCFVHCIKNAPAMKGRPYNAGLDDANLSKEELALNIKKFVGDLYIHFSEVGSDPDKRNYIVSNQRLRDAGFTAKRSLDDGIAELLKGYPMMVWEPFKNV